MRMPREDRRDYNRRKAEMLVRCLRRMIDEPIDHGHDRDMVEMLTAILNHEDRGMFG